MRLLLRLGGLIHGRCAVVRSVQRGALFQPSVFINASVRQMSGQRDERNIVRSQLPNLPIPEDISVPDLIVSRAKQFLDRVAMIDSESGAQHTYADLVATMNRVACGLRRRGLRKNDVVCIYSGNCIDFAYLMMGTMQAGGIVTTVNPAYTTNEVLYQLNDSQPKFFACHAAVSGVAAEACDKYGKLQERFSFGDAAGFSNFSTLLEADDAGEIVEEKFNPKEDVVLMPYSSGTTGVAKGVMLTHYNIVANLYQFNTPISDADRLSGEPETYISVLPLFHMYGIYATTLYSFFKGNTFVMMPRFDPTAYLKLVQEYKVTMLHVVPPMGLVLSRHPDLSKFDLSSAHSVLCAAAPMSRELEEEMKAALNVKTAKQGYGMTETSPIITMAAAEQGEEEKHGSVGLAVANTEIVIVDLQTGDFLPANKPGELWSRGPQNMLGYLNKPDATAATIDAEGWLHTGDVAYYDDDQYFYIVDRLKELIKYKGFQIAPAELEALLLTHPGIADAAVIGVADEEAGEVPKAFVVKKNPALTEDDVKQFVKDNLTSYKQLKGGVEFRDSIPKSPSGKILRRFLRAEQQ